MSKKSCNDCVNSYMGFGVCSGIYGLMCSEYDIRISADDALDCSHFKSEETLMLQKQKEIDQLQQNLDKAIEALEFYASTAAYEHIKDINEDYRYALIEDDEYLSKNKEGWSISKAGKFAMETIKEIRGEK